MDLTGMGQHPRESVELHNYSPTPQPNMPLSFHDTDATGTQFAVLSGNLRIAQISKADVPTAGRAVGWRWDFAISAGPRGFVFHGHVDTLDEAKAGVERN